MKLSNSTTLSAKAREESVILSINIEGETEEYILTPAQSYELMMELMIAWSEFHTDKEELTEFIGKLNAH